MELLYLVTLARSCLRNGWDWLRRYWVGAVAALLLIVVVWASLSEGSLLGVILAGWFIGASVLDALWWWFVHRAELARVRILRVRIDGLKGERDHWQERAISAEGALASGRSEIASRLARRAGGQT